MAVSGIGRSLPLRFSRSFSSTSLCRNTQVPADPVPPRRKGRTPRVNPKTESLLPADKMRALVSLYHQSDDFITMENLEERIDAAFLNGSSRSQVPHHELTKLLRERRSAPRHAPWQLESLQNTSNETSQWSETISGRERQVLDALCGVETLPGREPQPGYGTLMEEVKKKRQ